MRRQLMAVAGAVFCVTLCTAAPAGASTAWRAQRLPAPAGSAGQLQDVSCPVARVCIAVGYAVSNTTGIQRTLAERWSGGHWAIQRTPSPGNPAGLELLAAVSCLSAADCTAFGSYSTHTGSDVTLIEHWDGTRWSVVPSPNPSGTTNAELTGGSCTSPTSCTAVGLYVKGTGAAAPQAPLAEHWDGSSWTIQNVPLLTGYTAAELDGGVSCPSATDCTAVGLAYDPIKGPFLLLAEQWNGTRWTARAVTPPPGAIDPTLRGVSCSSPKKCTAVGSYLNGTATAPLAERWRGASWHIQAAPGTSSLQGVSCPSARSCTAVGMSSATGAEAERWNGTRWTSQTLPVPDRNTSFMQVLGVSCGPAASCTAVGSFGNGNPTGPERPLAEVNALPGLAATG